MGPVEQEVRRTFTAPVTLETLGERKKFVLAEMEDEGILLLLGQRRYRARLSWESLESIPEFLRGQGGWVPAGGVRSVSGEPGTLDEHLKQYLKTDVARWLVRVLLDSGIAEVAEGRPLRLRLAHKSSDR